MEVSLYDLLCGRWERTHLHVSHSTARDRFLSLAQHGFLYFFLSDCLQSEAHLMSVHGPSVYTFLRLRLCLGLTAGSVLAWSKSPSYLEKEKKVSGEIMDAFAIHGLGSRDVASGPRGGIIS